MQSDFDYLFLSPDARLAHLVESIGMFHNPSDQPKEVAIIPDGRIDLFFHQSPESGFQIWLMGLETEAKQRSILPHTLTFSISFKPLAIEYLLKSPIAAYLNSAKEMPTNFWGFHVDDLQDFEAFYAKASNKLISLLPSEIEDRKLKLFDLIYTSNGEMSVAELSKKACWNSRQINRYFSTQYGLSLKMFCKILRFRASLKHVAKGRLAPELNFTDQTHFIKDIKKFSGVVPRELSKNKNDRFVLLSVLKDQ